MRLVTFTVGLGPERLGVVLSSGLVLDCTAAIPGVSTRSMLDLIGAGPDALARVRELVEECEAAGGSDGMWLRRSPEVRLRAPIPRPRKNVVCVGLNYRTHVEQNAVALGQPLEIPELPLFFSKPVTAVVGTGDGILHDRRLTNQLDYEVELALVIGRRGSWISPNSAHEYVFGYTIVNDVSARDLQWRTSQFFVGKGLDTYCPMGPAIVDRASMPALEDVTLELRVNGEVRQRESAANMLFAVPEIVSELSKGMTLEPGDVISTGTPGGCGYQVLPRRFLKVGDVVECRAEPIGVLSNRVVAAVPARSALEVS